MEQSAWTLSSELGGGTPKIALEWILGILEQLWGLFHFLWLPFPPKINQNLTQFRNFQFK